MRPHSPTGWVVSPFSKSLLCLERPQFLGLAPFPPIKPILAIITGRNITMKQSILIISDLHIPYEHKDALAFLKAVKAKYKPNTVVCIGDEVDFHALSFHDSDVNLPSAGDELAQAKTKLKAFYRLFPNVTLVESNHGSMVLRKAFTNGLPIEVIKSYNEILEAPKGWKWVDDLTLKLSDGTSCYFHHSRGIALRTGQIYGMSHVCGHHHESFNINYWSTPERLSFAMTVGCDITAICAVKSSTIVAGFAASQITSPLAMSFFPTPLMLIPTLSPASA